MKKQTILFIFIIAIFLSCDEESKSVVNNVTIDIFKTGQTTTYGTEDDGDLQKGTAWANPRFTDNGDVTGKNLGEGTITDNLTGLMWQKTPDNTYQQWAAAVIAANDSEYQGYDDWRLPNVRELESLINSEVQDPYSWLNGLEFSNVSLLSYWTSTTSASDTTKAWHVAFSNARLQSTSKTSDLKTWFVRGDNNKIMKTGQTVFYEAGDDGDLELGVDWPDVRFSDNGNETITDNFTGLIWNKSSTTTAVNWITALTGANTLSFAGKDDWRMPNKRELLSLVDFGNNSLVDILTSAGFTDMQEGYYWTSTIFSDSTSKAFVVNSFASANDSGSAINNERTATAFMLFVRGN